MSTWHTYTERIWSVRGLLLSHMAIVYITCKKYDMRILSFLVILKSCTEMYIEMQIIYSAIQSPVHSVHWTIYIFPPSIDLMSSLNLIIHSVIHGTDIWRYSRKHLHLQDWQATYITNHQHHLHLTLTCDLYLDILTG